MCWFLLYISFTQANHTDSWGASGVTLGFSLLWPRGCLDSAGPSSTVPTDEGLDRTGCLHESLKDRDSFLLRFRAQEPWLLAAWGRLLKPSGSMVTLARVRRGKLLDHSPAPHFHLLTDMTGVAPALSVLMVPNTLYAQRPFFSW